MRKTDNVKPDIPNEERLVDAAIRCIEKYGAAKTFIDDIAREAGLSRPTAYRTFGSRKRLLEQVAARSVAVFGKRMRLKMRKYTNFADAITLGVVESLYLAKHDKVFMATLEALGDKGLERYLLDPAAPAFAYTLAAWAEAFDTARTEGQLRNGLSNDDLATLLCSVNCIFLLRDDMSKKEQIAFLRKFLLPAVMPQHALDALG